MTTDTSAGLDLFYNPTPLLRTNLTINTDFAQTEVDQRQVNLTRYSLFFPEQRDFFLDGATFFDFASSNGGDGRRLRSCRPERGAHHSVLQPPHRPERRCHAAEDRRRHQGDRPGRCAGCRVPARADGRRQRLRQRGLHGGAGETARVAAVLRRRPVHAPRPAAGRRRRHPHGGTRRAARDIDIPRASRISRGAGGSCTTAGPGRPSGNSAFGASLLYPNDLWNARIDATEVQENFDSAIGFVSRRAYRQFSQAVEFGPRPANHRYIRQVNAGASLDTLTDLEQRSAQAEPRRAAGPGAISFTGQFQADDRPPVRAPRYALRDHAGDHASPRRGLYLSSVPVVRVDREQTQAVRQRVDRAWTVLFRHESRTAGRASTCACARGCSSS